MKPFIYILCFCGLLISCNSTKTISTTNNEKSENTKANDTVTIANNDLEYEIIIIEPGFNFWLKSTAKPEGYYSQHYLESRNNLYVTEWNNRVSQPLRYDSRLYELPIDYQYGTDYGYEVNYKLYNYFLFAQRKYKMTLGFGPARLN